jgi:hypothetical protein
MIADTVDIAPIENRLRIVGNKLKMMEVVANGEVRHMQGVMESEIIDCSGGLQTSHLRFLFALR